jgi:1-aminocyclopropane-1-carboxylate deaminase/D-cysteine desulfhydrase-like pyridoxal-dependent ACC family enzyme
VVLDHEHLGPGYGIPTPEGEAAIRMLARTEGILTDPVYSGKGLAGLIEQLRRGIVHGPVVFWHTGGGPALFDPAHGAALLEARSGG